MPNPQTVNVSVIKYSMYQLYNYYLSSSELHEKDIYKASLQDKNQFIVDGHQSKGYMVSFNFNKKKEIGVKKIIIDDKILIEATV